MKKNILIFLMTMSSFLFCSCEMVSKIDENGSSAVSFETKGFTDQAAAAGLGTLDVDSFLFEVRDSKGIVYEGLFSGSPKRMVVSAGACMFKLQSREYNGPEFDKPVYGDKEVLDVEVGEEFEVDLACRQLTSGVQIIFSEDFKKEFPKGFIRITCRDTSTNDVESMDYHSTDTGFCHFLPGMITVDLVKESGSSPELLTGRVCAESEMFSVTVKMAPSEAYGTLKVEVDTVLVRKAETYLYGRKREGKTVFDAISVSDISSFAGDTVWVSGFVAGCYVNEKLHLGIDGETVSTNIALSPALNGATSCPVGISSGKCKSMNLKEYPEFLGVRVAIWGIAGKLYDMDGIKKALDYVLL